MPRSRPEFAHRAHDGVRFRIILPFGAAKPCAGCRVINSDFFNVEHKERGFAQLGFVQRKAEHRRDSARRDHDFLAFFQTRSHVRHKIGRDHPRNLARDGESGEALTLQSVGAQREAADQNCEHELKGIEFRVSERQLDKGQNYECDAKQHAIVPSEIYGAIECA